VVSADKNRILVVAEDSLARAGLAALITELSECFLAGQTGIAETLTNALEIFRPDIIIWDTGLNPLQSTLLSADLRRADVPVIALVPDAESASKISIATVRGILSRNIKSRELSAAVNAVASGLTVIDSNLAGQYLSAGNTPETPLTEALTPRELEVLEWLARGSSNKTIASKLSISEHTVKFHVNSILNKLGAESRTEAVARGSRFGLVRL
jgi:two-component system, NarL family, nitrate/nitrite response regulator NarL